MSDALLTADELAVDPVTAARRILGCDLVAPADADTGPVRLRIVEVEAYGGPEGGRHADPAAHSFPGPTPRNGVMFGRAGRLYVYRSYGIHLCLNVSAEVDGESAAVLLRAAEVTDGHDTVVRRRSRTRSTEVPADRLAMGPGNLGAAVAADLDDNGVDLCSPASPLRLERRVPLDQDAVMSGPRVGITIATGRPWRFWIAGSPAVSAFRAGSAAVRRRRLAAGTIDAEGSDW
ncbi:DNA-3-methyladenine glycosylase [Williamsia sp. MIQD14]|uniref:DNA-3-methyladenine glycosylase n=1 Tax=Williamsia sp. MIQD14 TaxID=3425703 RepID=UPI003DA10320